MRNGRGKPVVKSDIYATENPGNLYLKFEITYCCEDLKEEGWFDAQLSLKGDCYYSPMSQQCDNIRNFGEGLLFKTKDGEEKSIINQVIFANSVNCE